MTATGSSTPDARLRAVFAAVFGIDASKLSDGDSPQTIPEWDSLNHLTLVLALEEEYGVQFEAEEIPELASVAAIRGRLAELA